MEATPRGPWLPSAMELGSNRGAVFLAFGHEVHESGTVALWVAGGPAFSLIVRCRRSDIPPSDCWLVKVSQGLGYGRRRESVVL